jgi:ABC-type multidrug transport system fused ATPase/permease subunit
MNKAQVKNTISKLSALLQKRDKQLLIFLLFFSIIISLIETVGISVIMPFIAVATDFNLIENNHYYNKVYNIFGFSNHVHFVIAFGIALIIFYAFRSAVNLFYFHMLARFTQGRYYLLAYRLFENYMALPYEDFTKRNSSTLTKNILSEASSLTNLISAVLLMLSEIFIVLLIYGMMLWVNYKITLLLSLLLLINALFMVKTVSRKIKKAGIERSYFQKIYLEIVNKSFGNFKLLKLHSQDKETLQQFKDASIQFVHANITNRTLSHFPRLFLEAIGFGVIVFIITYLVWKYQQNISHALPIISMFVLALYRLMPSVNRIMNSYNQILFNYKSLDIIHSDLMYPTEDLGSNSIEFNSEISLNKIQFEYELNKPVLNNINLTIKKGKKIALIGESGSGKSTLVDIIIGLYKPKSGNVLIDGIVLDDANVKSWRSKIGYIPQTVYLFDGTVGENVAFTKDYDKKKVDACLRKAKIYDFLEPRGGQDVLVGGILLSGGQKQRIAIARALYTDPEVLILDEATSSLDNETEKKIMDEIYAIGADKTLIIIAHRLSTIEQCDQVYILEDRSCKKTTPYSHKEDIDAT